MTENYCEQITPTIATLIASVEEFEEQVKEFVVTPSLEKKRELEELFQGLMNLKESFTHEYLSHVKELLVQWMGSVPTDVENVNPDTYHDVWKIDDKGDIFYDGDLSMGIFPIKRDYFPHIIKRVTGSLGLSKNIKEMNFLIEIGGNFVPDSKTDFSSSSLKKVGGGVFASAHGELNLSALEEIGDVFFARSAKKVKIPILKRVGKGISIEDAEELESPELETAHYIRIRSLAKKIRLPDIFKSLVSLSNPDWGFDIADMNRKREIDEWVKSSKGRLHVGPTRVAGRDL